MIQRRLNAISLTDFRSIRGNIYTSLDAPIVLIHGPNGSGKTSVLSGIELALTGSVPSLSRVEPDYLNHLVHKQAENAKVTLDATGFDRKTASLAVDTKGITGNPTLDRDVAGFFSERCYLAQSALGRLLEIYQHRDARRSDSPLTQFVKDLLGLSRLDAIIDGLHTAGHITRLRNPVPQFHELREEIEGLEKELYALTIESRSFETSLHEGNATLLGLLQNVASSLVDISDPRLIIIELQKMPEESRLTALARIRREINAALAEWAALSANPLTDEREQNEQDARALQAQLDRWQRGPGALLANLIDEVAAMFPDLRLPSSTNPEQARTAGLRAAQKELARCANLLSDDERASARAAVLSQELERSAARVQLLDQQIQSISATTGKLAQTLAELLPHIHTDDCPVCGRDFKEVSRSPLTAYVSAHIASLTDHASRLEALSNEKASAAGASAVLERERGQLSARLISMETRNELKTRHARFGELVAQLTAIETDTKHGMNLLALSYAASAKLDQLRSRDQRITNLRETVSAIAKSLNVTVDEGLAIGNALTRVGEERSQEESRLAARQLARRAALEQARDLERLSDQFARLQQRMTEKRTRVANLREAKEGVEGVIHVARELAHNANEVRTNTVRRVFNDSLNKIWRDLFVRLAPDERFVPAFALPEGPGPVEAVLETIDRSGGKGGNPRAMLSAGNLNTAALTLFLSLHLAAKPQLPWLIIDDPVQSMDELHVAQFAVLLRTLSKAHDRQIILAVHERALFEYLALELSPAFPSDRLVTLELGRAADGATTHRWQMHIYEPDNAIAA